MLRWISCCVVLLWLSTAVADSATISASEARAGFGVPVSATTFADTHLALTRLILNESGWRSDADAIGIFRSLVSNSVGTELRVSELRHRTQFLRYLARVGNRTFPVDSPWLGLSGMPARTRHLAGQKLYGNALWTSSFKLDCSKPAHWDEVYPESDWEGYLDRCAALVVRTKALLLNKKPNWCQTLDGVPTSPKWWGGMMDMHRIQPDWQEVFCDAPDTECPQDVRNSPNTPSGCAKNRYFKPAPR